MSAAEVIDQLKKLGPEDRRKVRSYLEEECRPVEQSVSGEFKQIANRVFTQNEELFRKLAQ